MTYILALPMPVFTNKTLERKSVMKKVISMFLATLTLLSCFVVINVSAATGQDIVNEAKKWIGTKYGHSDGSGGPGTLVDCSGLVLQVYKKYGYNLTWSTSSQSKAGTQVNKSSLQLGDIVCFSNSTGSISHVGIYVGNDQMIHAPGDGKTVQYGSSISKWTLSQAKCKLEYGRRLIADPPSSTPTPAPSEQPSRPSSKPSPIGDVNTVLRWKELNKTYNKTTEQLQACLNYIMNAGLTVDGIYGIKTHDAVKAFQQKYGLKVDGDAGPQTLKKVNEVLATMGGGHTHNFSGTWHEAVHPHREYKKCNGCGETELTGKTVSDANCAQCTTPGKPVLLSMKKQYYADSEITFT